MHDKLPHAQYYKCRKMFFFFTSEPAAVPLLTAALYWSVCAAQKKPRGDSADEDDISHWFDLPPHKLCIHIYHCAAFD